MTPELPPEVLRTLGDLARRREPVTVTLRPWDAWVTVAVIQFASRNPALSPTQRQQAEQVGRAIQAAFHQIAPAAAALLEDGWDPRKDVPRE